MGWIGFFIGLALGSFFGMMIVSLLQMNREE